MNWFFLLLLVSTAFAADLSGVQVQGNCEVKVTPDMGSVSFTAEHQTKNQQDAVKKTNAQITELKEKLVALKFSKAEFKTTNYNVAQVREWEKDKLVDKGIKATMTLELTTTDIARLGEAMVKASEAGIQNVGSMVTFLSLEKSQSEYLKCLDIASHDAKKKAEQLAKKLGFQVGDVVNVVESPATMLRPVQHENMMIHRKSMADASPVSVDAGTQNFSTNIQVTFKIK